MRTVRTLRLHRTWPLTALVAAGCLTRPVEPIEPRRTATVVEPVAQSAVDKIDLVLAIDNSGSMADKQEILAKAVPDLVRRLVNPRCVDAEGKPAPEQPASVSDSCPPGTDREFEPITDIHIGIISSSLGAYGNKQCGPTDSKGNPTPDRNDFGHLLTRTKSGAHVGYDGKAFLAWDPEKKLDPPGIGDSPKLEAQLADLVQGVGQAGCGYEAQLESVYRFLADPDPPRLDGEKGIDTALLQERSQFLRPDSLLAVLMLTDENDCSVNEHAAVVLQQAPLWKPRQICETDPNDPCCKSCADKNVGDCPVDPTCSDPTQEDGIARLPAVPDHPGGSWDDSHGPNLRCFDQKRRFGFDGLYPTKRYVDAFTSPSIKSHGGMVVPNPIFSDLDPRDELTRVRTPDLVFFAGIVGVPWQDIAKNPSDLKQGFKTASELSARDPDSDVTGWDIILGDPATRTPPLDPFMQESVAPRKGTNPITGDPISAVSSGPNASTINGHEWNIASWDDLQYACVFDLPTSIENGADCTTPDADKKPLCQDDTGAYGKTQLRAKAYPGLRQLEVLKGLGKQGIVASTCPAYIGDDTTRDDYGYSPAIASIVDRLKVAFAGQCLSRSLQPDPETKQVKCIVVEAKKSDSCSCDGVARDPVASDHLGAIDLAKEAPAAAEQGWNCFCEVPQLAGKALEACQTQLEKSPTYDGKPVDGWCYVDATTFPPTGNPELVKDCAANEKREVRFVGEGKGEPGATMFVVCNDE